MIRLNLINTGAQPVQRATSAPRHGTQSLVRSLLHDPSMVSLGVALVIVWLSSNGLHQFEAIFLDELGAGESLKSKSQPIDYHNVRRFSYDRTGNPWWHPHPHRTLSRVAGL